MPTPEVLPDREQVPTPGRCSALRACAPPAPPKSLAKLAQGGATTARAALPVGGDAVCGDNAYTSSMDVYTCGAEGGEGRAGEALAATRAATTHDEAYTSQADAYTRATDARESPDTARTGRGSLSSLPPMASHRRSVTGHVRRLGAAVAGGFLLLTGGGCSGAGPGGATGPAPLLSPESSPSPANLKLVSAPARPRLALLARTGDPAPALVAVVATDVGSAPTVALAAVVEARLLAAGLVVDTRVDRASFRVRLLGGTDAASPKAFFAALAAAFRAPLGPGTPEIARASERVASLRRNPLPAPEAAPAADCAGRLGLAPRERALEPSTPEGLTELETLRARVLTAQRTALAAVGPAALCAEAEAALGELDEWPSGPAAEDPWPAADALGTHPANDVAKGRARVTVAVRVAEPVAAVAAAERLGDAVGPLRSRLSALPLPFHVTEVLGVARPRGGCISVTAESDGPARDAPAASALVAAIARKELAAEARLPADASLASRAVVAAADPRDAAARAAWWALSGSAAKGSPDRWATVLALPPDERGDLTAAAKRFEADFAAQVRAADAPVVERRAAVEEGQGEVWVLLASPCGTADETPNDAGASALAAIAAAGRARRAADLAVEPWITAEGVGVLAHAPALAGARREDDVALARRVASAAARAFAGEVPTRDSVADARILALTQIERTLGPQGAVLDGLLGAVNPDHPAQLHPLGTFTRLAALAAPSVAGRWQSLAAGPLRMAVLANGTPAQANAAFAAADHWLSPRGAPRACPTAADVTLRPGHYQVDPPPGAELAQAFIAVQVPGRGQLGREAAELTPPLLGTPSLLGAASFLGTAPLLGGAGVERGLIQAALDRTPLPATASARLLGGARSSALVIDIRAPESALEDAVTEVKAVLAQLAQDGPTDAAIEAARSRKQRADQEASFDPRARLVKLWLGDPPPPAPMTKDALRAFFAQTFRESSLVVVLAKRK